MQTIDLASTGRRATRLGFGCSSIMGGMNRRESLQTLEWAFDAGVRHFDVAPMYGFGAAEGCLGEFLQRHRDEVTVTTKFGIPPAKNTGVMSFARTLARPLLKTLPGLKRRAQKAANTVAAAPSKRDLSAVAAERSLGDSLRQLRVERIDVFLLHDVTIDELQDEALLRFLEDARQRGSIGAFGVGTGRDAVAKILLQASAYAAVVQQEWSVFDGGSNDEAFHIHHRSLAHHRTRLQLHLTANPAVAARWSAEVGADLEQLGTLSALMMRAALLNNPKGIVLFSSRKREHIASNAALAEPSAMDAQAAALYRVVQREAATIAKENTA